MLSWRRSSAPGRRTSPCNAQWSRSPRRRSVSVADGPSSNRYPLERYARDGGGPAGRFGGRRSLSRASRFILRKVNCGGSTGQPQNFAGYRWFESISLQRGVTCEPEFSEDRSSRPISRSRWLPHAGGTTSSNPLCSSSESSTTAFRLPGTWNSRETQRHQTDRIAGQCPGIEFGHRAVPGTHFGTPANLAHA